VTTGPEWSPKRAAWANAMQCEARRALDALPWLALEAWVGLSHGRGFMPRRIKVVTRSKYWHVKIRIGIGGPRDLVFEASWGLPWKMGGVRFSYAETHKPAGTDWYPVLTMTPARCVDLAGHCTSVLGAGYDWISCLRFVPWIRHVIGEREGVRQRLVYNCSKFGVKMIRAIGLEPIPRKSAFRVSPGDFVYSALLADPVTLDANGPTLVGSL